MPFEGRLFFPDDFSSADALLGGRSLDPRAGAAQSAGVPPRAESSGELTKELADLGEQLSTQAGELAARYPSSQRRASTFAAAIAARAKASSRRRHWLVRGAIAAAALLAVGVGAARFAPSRPAPQASAEASALASAVAPRKEEPRPAIVGGAVEAAALFTVRLDSALTPQPSAAPALDALSLAATGPAANEAGAANGEPTPAGPELFDAFFECDGSIREAIVDLEQDGQLERASFSL